MDKSFRLFNYDDCTRKKVSEKETFLIRSFVEYTSSKEFSNYVKMICFLDEKNDDICFIPYGSIIKVKEKKYKLIKGGVFVLEEYKESALTDLKYIYLEDNCLLGDKDKIVRLREFEHVEVKLISLPQ